MSDLNLLCREYIYHVYISQEYFTFYNLCFKCEQSIKATSFKMNLIIEVTNLNVLEALCYENTGSVKICENFQ